MKARGFTLIELLVAMTIFAVISVMALGGLNAVVKQQELAREDMQALNQLQRAVRDLVWDFSQLQPRYVRDELGQGSEAPLLADGRLDYLVRLTRGGWRNPAGFPRGTLQRVQYRLEEGALIREYWPVLDHPLGMEPRSVTLLEDVVDLRLFFLDDQDEWQPQWPPLSAIDAPVAPRPRAVRLELELDGWGEIQRLIELTP